MLKLSKLTTVLVMALAFTACQKQTNSSTETKNNNALAQRKNLLQKKNQANVTGSVKIFATGFNNPRGLEFGPDGNLYVAEAGIGGSTPSTNNSCQQVPFPVGPYLGSTIGGGISMVSPGGVKTVLTNQLPTSSANEIIGGDVEGVADIAFIGDQMYALLAGAGCSHGVPSIQNGVIKVNADGSWSMVADISTWLKAHPVQNPNPDDFEPDGTPYSMVAVRGDFYVVEPNHGDFLKVSTDGTISRVADISASQGHIVPTAVAYHGNFFVGNLNTFPITEGSSKILKINPDGEVKVWATGLTSVLGIAIDKKDRIYVLENTVGAPFPTPGLGKIVRIDPSGAKTVVASGLSLPTGLTLGPDGKLYVSNIGLGPDAIGGGQVLQVSVE
jgi:glucose/arabinose dehydrogenase